MITHGRMKCAASGTDGELRAGSQRKPGFAPIGRTEAEAGQISDRNGGRSAPEKAFWWWSRLVSNQRPSACEADALPLSYETGDTVNHTTDGRRRLTRGWL